MEESCQRAHDAALAGIPVGQSFAFPVNEDVLHVEPPDKLSPLVGHEWRTIADAS